MMNRLIVKPIDSVMALLIRSMPPKEALSFYARTFSGSAGRLRQHFAKRIFYEVIDPDIRGYMTRDPGTKERLIDEYMRLLFKERVALEWSESKRPSREAMFSYYLKDGTSSCMTQVVETLNNSAQPGGGWKLLDIGSAGGNCIDILMDLCGEKISRIDGMDSSEEAIAAAKERFDDTKHSFWADDLRKWLRSTPACDSWKYDIGYAHLVFQLFPEEYLREVYELLYKKKICRSLLVSDSVLAPAVGNESLYNPGIHGYIRWDHNHAQLMRDAGYTAARVMADHRTPREDADTMQGFMVWGSMESNEASVQQ